MNMMSTASRYVAATALEAQGELRRPEGAGLFRRVWRRKGWFLAALALVLALVGAALALIPPNYVATGSIIIGEQEPNASPTQAAQVQRATDPGDIESQLQLLRSPRIMRAALARPGSMQAVARDCAWIDDNILVKLLRRPTTCDKLLPGSDAALEYGQKHFTVRSIGRSRVISVSYDSADPQAARTLVNALITTFLEDQRTVAVKSRELSRLSQLLATAEASEAQAFSQLQEVAGTKPGGGTKTTQDNRAVTDLKQQLGAVLAQYANQSQSLGASHPSVKALQRQRDELQAKINDEVSGIVSGARQTYQSAQTVTRSLRDRIDAIERGPGPDPATLSADERAFQIGGTRLVGLAELPSEPTFPKKVPFIASGVTLGIIFGIAAALFRDRADRAVRSPADVSAASGVHVPAVIPKARGTSTGDFARLLRRRRPGPVAAAWRRAQKTPATMEALRRLQAHLVLHGFGSKRKSLLVTSARPGEGKTFTVLALAHLFAASGRRVLVVDADLGKPMIADLFKVDAGDGIVPVLRGQLAPLDATVPTEHAGIDVLAPASSDPGSTDLLMAGKLGRILDWGARYDVVLVDCSASMVRVDAQLLAQHAGGILCCAEWGRTSMQDAIDCAVGMQASGGHVVGIALNLMDQRRARQYDIRVAPPRAYPVVT